MLTAHELFHACIEADLFAEPAPAPPAPVPECVLASGVTEKGRMYYEMYEQRFGAKPTPQPVPVIDLAGADWLPVTTQAQRLKLRTGDKVAVRMDLGEVLAFTVQHPPWQAESGDWVISFREMAGCYLLERVVARRVG